VAYKRKRHARIPHGLTRPRHDFSQCRRPRAKHSLVLLRWYRHHDLYLFTIIKPRVCESQVRDEWNNHAGWWICIYITTVRSYFCSHLLCRTSKPDETVDFTITRYTFVTMTVFNVNNVVQIMHDRCSTINNGTTRIKRQVFVSVS